MTANILVTPDDVAKALRLAPSRYREMHEMNAENSLVRGCRLGAVFSYNGQYYIYVGLNGANRKFPVIVYRVSDWSRRKLGHVFFAAVRAASQS